MVVFVVVVVVVEIDLTGFITVCLLQIVCRLLAGYFLISSHGTVSNPYLGILSHFHSISA